MGFWDGLRSRLFGDEPEDRTPQAPCSESDLTPPTPLSDTERGESDSLLPPLRVDTGIPRSGGAPSFVEEGDRGGEVSPEGREREVASDGWGDEVPARQERAAGRILDDEGLRGDLADDEYQPLLDWALSVTDRLVAATAGLDDEQADARIEDGSGTLREVMRAAADAIVAHNEGRAEDRRWALDAISQTWRPSLVGCDESDMPATLWQPLQQLADRLDAEPDLFGPDVAAAIVAALALPTEGEGTESPPGAPRSLTEAVGDVPSEPSEESP